MKRESLVCGCYMYSRVQGMERKIGRGRERGREGERKRETKREGGRERESKTNHRQGGRMGRVAKESE